MRRIILAAVCIPVFAMAVTAADSTAAAQPDSAKVDSVKVFTLEELAAFDGKDGKPAYIAVDGIVYDVSKASGWKKGKHKGYSAGKDVTAEINKKSPHGTKVMKKNPVVGKLAAEPAVK